MSLERIAALRADCEKYGGLHGIHAAREALDGWEREIIDRAKDAEIGANERDEARRHARDHHLEGGCLTCMATESERDEARVLAARLYRRGIAIFEIDLAMEAEARLREWFPEGGEK